MPLKAKKPEIIEKRMKLFVFGPAGIGKTTAAIQFPNSIILDMERGTDEYAETIQKSGSVVLKTTNPDEIREEIRTLLTEKHPYKTLIIDPITQLYNAIQEKWTRIFEKYSKTEKEAEMQDFGMRYWGRVKSEYKSIMRLILQLDMNVILTAHQKDTYEGMTKTGVGPDSMRGDGYIFDLILQLTESNGKRVARVIKERAEMGKQKFPFEFPWSYQNFCQFYGKTILEREAEPVEMATTAQVDELKKLIEVVKVSDDDVSKWLEKAGVDNFSEMTAAQIQKCIDFVNKRLSTLGVK